MDERPGKLCQELKHDMEWNVCFELGGGGGGGRGGVRGGRKGRGRGRGRGEK